MATIAEKQEKILQELASALNITDHEKALKQIRTREATNQQFQRIRTTLGQLKSGGLAGVDVPILAENREISGWRSVTKPDKLNEVITQHNRNHLHQAPPTPLGHGKGYGFFHGEGRHETAKQVLDGQLEWTHPVAEVNAYIKNLQQAFDEASKKEKIEKINAIVTAGEFRHYFKKKNKAPNPPLPAGTSVIIRQYWGVTNWWKWLWRCSTLDWPLDLRYKDGNRP